MFGAGHSRTLRQDWHGYPSRQWYALSQDVLAMDSDMWGAYDLFYVLVHLYALVHEFLELVIEGDEAYTKVQKNVSPDQSPGWTILLMDRASRFIWE